MAEPRGRAVKLFAGAGGSCLGAKAVGIEGPGIELDPVICRTRIAAGLETIEGSVLDYSPADFPDTTGLIGTPPCQLFSTAGTGEARKMLPEILAAVAAMGRGEKPDTEGWPIGALLVLEPLRWIIEAVNMGRPYEWVVLEQVPPVLPIWQAYGEVLSAGYGVAAANLQSEMFGVPQTRKRAIFVARLGKPAKLPTPTHSRYYPRDPKRLDPGVLPWVSMAEALPELGGSEVVSNYTNGGSSGWQQRFDKFVTKSHGDVCWVWSGATDKDGYGIFQMGGRANKAHRLSLLGAYEREAGGVVRHSCDNPPCVNPAHLRLGTMAQNAADMVERERYLPGEKNAAAKLTPSDVAQIRTMAAAGQTAASIARAFSMSHSQITRIIKGESWDSSARGRRHGGEPFATVTSKVDRNVVYPRGMLSAGGNNTAGQRERPPVEPSATITGKGTAYWQATDPKTIRVTVQEAGILQSFPPDFPWAGDPEKPATRTMQYRMVGNSAPVLLVEAVVRALLED